MLDVKNKSRETWLNSDLMEGVGLTSEQVQCQSARLSRDSRFDGRFFVVVKTLDYQDMAIAIDNPKAVLTVGLANGKMAS